METNDSIFEAYLRRPFACPDFPCINRRGQTELTLPSRFFLVPILEFLFAVFQQLVVILEVQIEAFFARDVALAIVVGVIAAGLRAGLVDAAAAVGLQMCASDFEQQVPGAFIPEGVDALVRHLPEQVRKILFGARGGD